MIYLPPSCIYDEVSSLFSNVLGTLGLHVVPIFGVLFFREEMSGIKLIAMILAIWGFVSYAYQHYVDDRKPNQHLVV
uniref:Putative purine permease 6 n=1 Tax=Noccaea caerulescens TaxID=107243 RepID=A0A1J3FDG3_NOCCA